MMIVYFIVDEECSKRYGQSLVKMDETLSPSCALIFKEWFMGLQLLENFLKTFEIAL